MSYIYHAQEGHSGDDPRVFTHHSTKTCPIIKKKNSNVSHKNETKLVGQLEVEVGNGEWGSLGSFSE